MPLQTQQVSLEEELEKGLTHPVQKYLPTHYLYDDAGSALFDAITDLPEYGLTRADERLLRKHGPDIASLTGARRVIDLGSGSGEKARLLLSAFGPDTVYAPIDVSKAALANCVANLPEFQVDPVEAEFLPGLSIASSERRSGPVLVTFLGSNIGNFERPLILPFLRGIRERLEPGDYLLLGIDLVKPVPQLIAAYDDAAGVTAAFNRNLLVRLNREFGANFNVDKFEHVAVWNTSKRRIEMHLRALADMRVTIRDLGVDSYFRSGETIHTESSHKFEVPEVTELARSAGYRQVALWKDNDWPFAEVLFRTV
jgi:dimethylhistidine N-methyltransferase